MLQPKKSKYRKQFRGKRGGVATRGSDVSFGNWGLKALENGWLTARQIESARRTITHHTKRDGKLWIRVFPHKPVTKKAAGAKMGGGKGDIDEYVAVIKPGTVILELGGIDEEVAREAMRKAAHKIPMKVRVVERGEIN